MTAYPLVRLGEFVAERKEFMIIEEMTLYKRARVQWYGKGILLRDEVLGSALKTKKQKLIYENDFVVAEIDAKEGGFGVTPKELDGAIVSSHYFVFEVNQSVCNPRYLEWFIRTNNLQNLVTAQGSTNYSAVRPEQMLLYSIPLPSLVEQRRIVARIEGLAQRVEEARGLRREAVGEVEALLASATEDAFAARADWTEAMVGEFCESPQYGYTAPATDEPLGPRMLRITDIQDGRVNWEAVPFCECLEPEKYLLREGDLVFARTGATTGKSFVIRDCPESVFASYLIRLRVRELVTVDYLHWYFQAPSYWMQITEEKKGTGQPNVNGKKLANLRVPIAPADQQYSIVAYLDGLQAKVDELKRLQAETQKELDALMPSILARAFAGEL